MFRKILVPVDLTDKNVAALTEAAELVRRDGGSIVVLHVVETLDEPFDELEDFYHQLEATAREEVRRLVAPLVQAGLTLEQIICYGKRVPMIVRYARDCEADLIVITSHQIDPAEPGRSWMTISHQIAILAPCPVLLLR
jgi:nucleotide-binding universal stress UspA family protein